MAATMQKPSDNPKTQLVNFLQRFLSQTLAKSDVVFTNTGDSGMFQSVVKLVCHKGEEFAGQVCPSEKEAEQSAAAVALAAFAPQLAALPPPGTKKKKERPEGAPPIPGPAEEGNYKTLLVQALQAHTKRCVTKTDIVYEFNTVGALCQATVTLNCIGGVAFAGEAISGTERKGAEQSAAHQALLAKDSWGPAVPVDPEAAQQRKVPDQMNPKTELMMFVQGHLKRTLTKTDITYTHTPEGPGGGVRAIVTMTCLEGQQFAGEPRANQKEAENSAAAQALKAFQPMLASVPALAKLAQRREAEANNPQPPAAVTPTPKKQRAPKKEPVEAGPRSVVSATAIPGEVVHWHPGGWGYVKPTTPLGHELESMRQGKIYVHKSDLKNELKSLEKGQNVQMTIYSDNLGLGGADVVVV